MDKFLSYIESPEGRSLYRGLDDLWNTRAEKLNRRLRADGLPVQVANLSTIWTVSYNCPSRYNWMLQYYLRAEGLALSWTGTGRFIFSLKYSEVDFEAVADRFVAACRSMERDGWWWCCPGATNKSIQHRIIREMIMHRFLRCATVTQNIAKRFKPSSTRANAGPAPT